MTTTRDEMPMNAGQFSTQPPVGRGQRLPTIAFALLFAGLALTSLGRLAGSDYVRLVALLAAIGVVWRFPGTAGGVLLATAALLAAAATLQPPTWEGLRVGLWLGAISSAGIGLRRAAVGWSRGSRVEVIAAVLTGAVWGISLAAASLWGLDTGWPISLQWPSYFVFWLVVGRWLGGMAQVERRRLLALVVWVLGVTCLVGAWTVGMTLYRLQTAAAALAGGKYETAAGRYRDAGELAERLALTGVQEKSRLGLAQSLTGMGRVDQARRVVGLPGDGPIVIEPDQWKGPSGGYLFKNVSCWVDLWLWEGVVEVDLQARGRAAGGVWPRLRVSLGGKELGEVEVPSAAFGTFRLSGQAATGRQRLEVRLVNGFWNSEGEHRWARLGKVEVHGEEANP